MQQHVLRGTGLHLELLVLGQMFFGLIVWLSMILGLHLVDGCKGAREGVDVVVSLVLQDGDEALRFAFGAVPVRVDEVGVFSTGPVEREVLLKHEPADADRVHRLVEHERVEGVPEGVHVLVDLLIRRDLPVGRHEPERSVHLEELIAIIDATASTHQVILSPGVNDPLADFSHVGGV